MKRYADYPVKPYISPKRDLETELFKPVPRRNMEPLAEGLLAGDIILLWRIAFGTYTTETWVSKYFEYTYGIDADSHLVLLIEKGYVRLESAFESLDHLSAGQKKQFLKDKSVTGLSKMKAADVDAALKQFFSEEELSACFTVRGLALTEKGQDMLAAYPDIIDRHPKKKF
ncbi:hypothetical protein ACVR1I_01825 [Streptococcus cameli]